MNASMMVVPFAVAGKRLQQRARAAVAWHRVPVRCGFGTVPLRALRATQSEVYAPRVGELRDSPGSTGAGIPIVVARIDGVFVVVDGHHRATAHFLAVPDANIRAFIVEPMPRLNTAKVQR